MLEPKVRPPILLYAPNDDDVLSGYQVFLRKQIEFFEANMKEVDTPTPAGHKKTCRL
jgi:hypothetical protein